VVLFTCSLYFTICSLKAYDDFGVGSEPDISKLGKASTIVNQRDMTCTTSYCISRGQLEFSADCKDLTIHIKVNECVCVHSSFVVGKLRPLFAPKEC
jgi:hypothetical protein